MPWFEICVAISELVAAYLIVRLWKSGDNLFFKISYSAIAIVPFIGPFFVIWSANFPPRQHPAFQDRRRYQTDVLDRWRHVIDEKNPFTKLRMWQQMSEKNENDNNP